MQSSTRDARFLKYWLRTEAASHAACYFEYFFCPSRMQSSTPCETVENVLSSIFS